MSEQKKKQTIILAVTMIICIILTSLLLGKSVICRGCDKKLTGKYYNGGFSDTTFYCKECAIKYYGPWFSKDMALSVDNTLRNILVVVEIIGFAGALVYINKKKIEEVAKSDDVKGEIVKRVVAVKDDAAKKISEIKTNIEKERKNTATDVVTKDVTPKTVVSHTEVKPSDNIVENPASAGKSILRTTFKTKTEADVQPIREDVQPIKEDKPSNDEWFKSAGDL